jgi:CheY-like chemotaxis protein
MFVQLDRALEQQQVGLGIGLALARRIVEMHGGRLHARSEGPGRGSEFSVALPQLPGYVALEAPEAADASARPPAALRRFLVVDDNEDLATSLASLLRLSGREAQVAHDGASAVRAVAAVRPDVVLLDIGMPKMNGYEACRRMRETPGGEQLLIVAMTGWGQSEDRERSRLAGFDAHVVKPVRHAALMELLAELRPGR